LTGGEAHDGPCFEILLDLGPGIVPRAVITDKAYDAKANRAAARKRGICPVIPYRSPHDRKTGVLSEKALQGTSTYRSNSLAG